MGGGGGEGGGGSWYFAHGCGLCSEGGPGKNTHQVIGGKGGLQKMQGKKSKITIALPLHKLSTIPYESGHKESFDCILIGSLAI